MGLFSFLSPKKQHVIAIVDIGSASIGGAYVVYTEHSEPTIYFTTRATVEKRQGEEILEATLRTLTAVGKELSEKGGPVLYQEIGDFHLEKIFVSIAAPWQDTRVHIESLQGDRPFTFTKALMQETLTKARKETESHTAIRESVVATILNGYETHSPFGKKVKRADLVVLSSSIEKKALEEFTRVMRHVYHTHDTEVTSFAPAVFTVFRDLYPHQKDFLVVDVTGEATDSAFIKNGYLSGVRSMPHGLNHLTHAVGDAATALTNREEKIQSRVDTLVHHARNMQFSEHVSNIEKEWIEGMRTVFSEFATGNALPRTIFLLVDKEAREFLKHLLDTDTLRKLWLSNDPLTIVPMQPEHLASFIKTRGVAEGDLFLSVLALFYQKRFSPIIQTHIESKAL